jgi:hypothetical protein
MLIVDASEVKLPGEAKQNNLPPKCGQPIDGWIICSSNGPKTYYTEFKVIETEIITDIENVCLKQMS